MGMTIKSKIHNYGHEHESEWPSKYPKDARGLVGYIDPDTKEFKEGYPPNPNNQFGVAPNVIFDSIKPEYHEGACRMVDSRKEWERLDHEHNKLTFGSVEESRRHVQKGMRAQRKAVREDRRRADRESRKMNLANPEEASAKRRARAEEQIKVAKESGLAPVLKEQGIEL